MTAVAAKTPSQGAGLVAPPLALADLTASLREGFEEVKRARSDALFLALVWPVLGVVLAGLAAGRGAVEMIFPLVSGFALIGPLAAVGLYESSRAAERGEAKPLLAAYRDAWARAGRGMAKMAGVLFALFLAWLLVARALWSAIMGVEAPESLGALLSLVLATPQGWLLIVIGHAVGAVFAATAMALSVFSLPMLLDGERSANAAMIASARACAANPRVMLAWGLIVGAGLALASLPALAGLVLALPVFGHATWRLYRRAFRR